MPLNESATVAVLAGFDTAPLPAKLIDLSTSGAGLQVTDFIMRGLPVEVQWSGGAFRGKVQYCRTLNTGGYKLGLRLD